MLWSLLTVWPCTCPPTPERMNSTDLDGKPTIPVALYLVASCESPNFVSYKPLVRAAPGSQS